MWLVIHQVWKIMEKHYVRICDAILVRLPENRPSKIPILNIQIQMYLKYLKHIYYGYPYIIIYPSIYIHI